MTPLLAVRAVNYPSEIISQTEVTISTVFSTPFRGQVAGTPQAKPSWVQSLDTPRTMLPLVTRNAQQTTRDLQTKRKCLQLK